MPRVWQGLLGLSQRYEVETQITNVKEILKEKGFPYTFRILGYFYSQRDLDKHLGEFYEYDYVSLFFYKGEGASENFVQMFFEDGDVAMRAALILGG